MEILVQHQSHNLHNGVIHSFKKNGVLLYAGTDYDVELQRRNPIAHEDGETYCTGLQLLQLMNDMTPEMWQQVQLAKQTDQKSFPLEHAAWGTFHHNAEVCSNLFRKLQSERFLN